MPKKILTLVILITLVLCLACTNAYQQEEITRHEYTETEQEIETDQLNTKKISSEENKLLPDKLEEESSVEDENIEEVVVEAHVDHASAISSDGVYRIETYGVLNDSTAGGLYAAEGIRLVEIESEQVLWSMSPGYYTHSFVWSPNNRYVAVYTESRISGETFVVDTVSKEKITLPSIEQVRNFLNAETTVNEARPDPYFRFLNWEDNDQLSVSFQWIGAEHDGFEGLYRFNVAENKLIDASLN